MATTHPFKVAYDARTAQRTHESTHYAPATSHWTEREQDGWTAWITANRLPDMSRSKYGRLDTLAVGEMGESAGSKLQRAKRQAAGYQTLGMRI
jgi:hypothetical protein